MKAKIEVPFPKTAGDFAAAVEMVGGDPDTPIRVIGSGRKARLVIDTTDDATGTDGDGDGEEKF